jgi:hypothetical protein
VWEDDDVAERKQRKAIPAAPLVGFHKSDTLGGTSTWARNDVLSWSDCHMLRGKKASFASELLVNAGK